MGREVRKVPADWQHPKDERGRYTPLLDGNVAELQRKWDEENAKWNAGFRSDFKDGWKPREPGDGDFFEDWHGRRPDPRDYMPQWNPEQATHFMMYEDTSEGTPISPAFKTPEELARWLTDNNASAFGDMKASYEGWLRVARGGFAPSAILDAKGFRSGVDV